MPSQNSPTRYAQSRVLRGLAALLTFNLLLGGAACWLIFVQGFDASASEPVSLMAFEPTSELSMKTLISESLKTQPTTLQTPLVAVETKEVSATQGLIAEAALAAASSTNDVTAHAATQTIVEEIAIVEAIETGPTFNGRPLRAVKTIRMLVTAYSPDEKSCGKWADGITASGYSVWTNGMKLVAADTSILPFGSIISVPGYDAGRPVPVLDRGGKIKGKRLDVLYPTHEIALGWGAKHLDVTVWEYAD